MWLTALSGHIGWRQEMVKSPQLATKLKIFQCDGYVICMSFGDVLKIKEMYCWIIFAFMIVS